MQEVVTIDASPPGQATDIPNTAPCCRCGSSRRQEDYAAGGSSESASARYLYPMLAGLLLLMSLGCWF